jgi:hypothetical protein
MIRFAEIMQRRVAELEHVLADPCLEDEVRQSLLGSLDASARPPASDPAALALAVAVRAAARVVQPRRCLDATRDWVATLVQLAIEVPSATVVRPRRAVSAAPPPGCQLPRRLFHLGSSPSACVSLLLGPRTLGALPGDEAALTLRTEFHGGVDLAILDDPRASVTTVAALKAGTSVGGALVLGASGDPDDRSRHLFRQQLADWAWLEIGDASVLGGTRCAAAVRVVASRGARGTAGAASGRTDVC